MSNPVVEGAIQNMPSGTHAILVYDSMDNKRDVLFSHLKAGARKEGLVYVCSEESEQEIRQELSQSGVEVETMEARKELQIERFDDVYIVDGKIDTPKIMAGFSDLAWSFRRKGKDGLRAAAEMSCFLRENRVPELIEYEQALHRKLPFPAKGICAYNLIEMGNRGELEALWPILRAHALVIMTGPHGSFALEPERVGKAQVNETMGVSL